MLLLLRCAATAAAATAMTLPLSLPPLLPMLPPPLRCRCHFCRRCRCRRCCFLLFDCCVSKPEPPHLPLNRGGLHDAF
jgi:hypothetical protein